MKNNFLAIILIISTTSLAQSGGDFEIKKSSIDAGGGESAGGNFKVNGTIGQADATAEISGGNFSLTAGFWSSEPVILEELMFNDGFETFNN